MPDVSQLSPGFWCRWRWHRGFRGVLEGANDPNAMGISLGQLPTEALVTTWFPLVSGTHRPRTGLKSSLKRCSFFDVKPLNLCSFSKVRRLMLETVLFLLIGSEILCWLRVFAAKSVTVWHFIVKFNRCYTHSVLAFSVLVRPQKDPKRTCAEFQHIHRVWIKQLSFRCSQKWKPSRISQG